MPNPRSRLIFALPYQPNANQNNHAYDDALLLISYFVISRARLPPQILCSYVRRPGSRHDRRAG